MFGHGLWCCPSSFGCLWCSWLGFGFGLLMGRVCFRGRPACPPPFPVPACGVGVCAAPGSRLCPALLRWGVGLCFLRFCFFFLWVFLSRALWSLSPHPLSFGLGWWLSFFFLLVSVSLFPVGRCSWLGVAGFGWLVPLCLFGGPVFGAFRAGVWPPLVVLAGGLAAVGCFRAFSPSPLRVFFLGGGLACSSLCLPWAGARTGLHSVLSSGLLFSFAFCLAAFRPHGSGGLCTRWARRPFLPG